MKDFFTIKIGDYTYIVSQDFDESYLRIRASNNKNNSSMATAFYYNTNIIWRPEIIEIYNDTFYPLHVRDELNITVNRYMKMKAFW